MIADKKVLQVLDKIFKEHDITYWLEGGTLIGALREGRLLSWDSDMDVCVWFKDMPKICSLQKEFNQNGYSLHSLVRLSMRKTSKSEHLMCIIPMKVYKGKLMTLELVHPLRKFMESLVIATSRIKGTYFLLYLISLLFSYQRCYFSRYKYLGNFAYVKLEDDYYPIPEHVEKYLEVRFSRWRTPCKGLEWAKRVQKYNAQYRRKRWSLM